MPRCSASTGRVHVGDGLADDVGEDALEGGELEDLDVVLAQLALHLDVDADDRAVCQGGEDLAELLDERDARADVGVDDAARDVDGIGHELAGEGEADGLGDRDAGLLLRLVGGGAQMRSEDDVVELEERRSGRRLGDEDVDAGAGDPLGLERGVERILVDDPTAARVDDAQLRLGDREHVGVDQAGRLGRLRDVDGDEVARPHELLEREQGDPQLLRATRRDVRVVADEVRTEAGEPLGDEGADPAEADDADGLLEQLDAAEPAALPLAALGRRVGVGDVPGEGEQVADGELRRGRDVGGGRIDDHHARSGRGGDVDVVEADTGTGDDLQLRGGGDRLGVHLGRGSDEHGAGVSESGEQRGPVGPVDAADVEVGAEGIDGGGREFFGDQHDRLCHVSSVPRIERPADSGGRGAAETPRRGRWWALKP